MLEHFQRQTSRLEPLECPYFYYEEKRDLYFQNLRTNWRTYSRSALKILQKYETMNIIFNKINETLFWNSIHVFYHWPECLAISNFRSRNVKYRNLEWSMSSYVTILPNGFFGLLIEKLEAEKFIVNIVEMSQETWMSNSIESLLAQCKT